MTATVPARRAARESEREWVRVCLLTQVDRERGVAVLIGARQIAVFRTHTDELYALDNLDPFSGAMVLSRGIVGTRDAIPTVASPMYKQVFDLRTGRCFDDPDVSIGTHGIRVVDGGVEVSVRGAFDEPHSAVDSTVRGS